MYSILSRPNSGTAKRLSLSHLSKRGFAGAGDEVIYPKKYKNVFNRWVSRDKKRVYYTVYPHDYNEPWPFPPVYEKDGEDRNVDKIWGKYGRAPPSSITGKPRRALGHYPWLGRAIVPLDQNKQWMQDDQVAPHPFFKAGRYEANKTFYRNWFLFFTGFFLFWYWLEWWRGPTMTKANQRDELWYKEVMCASRFAFAPLAATRFSNPSSPIGLWRPHADRWRVENWVINFRYEAVFIPGCEEDRFGHCRWDKFSFETDGWIHPALRKKSALPGGHHHHHNKQEPPRVHP